MRNVSLKILFAVSAVCAGSTSLFAQTAPSQNLSVQQHKARAQQLLQQRRPDLAISELEAVVSAEPDNAEAQGNLGVLLYFAKSDEKAIPHFQAALHDQPGLWKIEVLLGLAELRLRRVADGQAHLAESLPHLKGDKAQREAGDALVDSYTSTGDLDKAASTITVLLDSSPTDPRLLLSSYRLYSKLTTNALLTLALTNPESAELHQAMAQELAKHGDDTAAIANYREALRLNPLLPGVHLELGNLLFDSPDVNLQAQAAVEFQAAVAQTPQDERAQLMLGMDAAARSDLDTAYRAESLAVQLQPDDPDACTELAKTLMARNQKDRAQELLLHALKIEPTNETAHYRLSTLYRQQGKMEEAKRELAEYKKYKEMKEKLRTIFRNMRTKMDDKSEDDSGMSK